VLVLGALFAFAENQSTLFPSQSTTSASFMLAMAAMVVFAPQDAYAGPALVAAFGGLFLPDLRARDWRRVLFNSAMYGLATLVATAVFFPVVHALGTAWWSMLVAALPAALAFSAVNLLLLALVLAFWRLETFTGALPKLIGGHLQIYPFALLGVLLGFFYLEYGVVLVPLFIVPILVARQTFSSYTQLKESQEAAVRTLIGALEAKDPYTAGHAERVAGYAHYIGRELGMSPSRLERLRFAALMHDVGKLVVPNHLLNKKGKLTAEEFAHVRRHEEVSVEILTRIDFLAPVAPSATSEAAEFAPVADDRGQPIEPHIVAVADAFDAMTSTRSYRKALPQEIAFDELRRNSGKQFHPRVVDALIIAIEQRNEVHGRGHEDVVHHEDAPEVGTGSAGLGDLMADVEAGSESTAGR
jgi:hypothetical protein